MLTALAWCVEVDDTSDGDVTKVYARVLRAVPLARPLHAPPSPLPSHITRHSSSPSPRRPTSPSVCTVGSSRGVAAVSFVDSVVSTKWETAATTSFGTTFAVGFEFSNGQRVGVDVPANLGGSSNHGTPTAPLTAPAATLGLLDAVGAADRRAEVHDSVKASSGSDAWRSTPRLVLEVTNDVLVDATLTTLERPGSDPPTSDTAGNGCRAIAIARGTPPGTDARTGGGMQAVSVAAGRSDRKVSAGATDGVPSRSAQCNQDGDQASDKAFTRATHASAAGAAMASPCALNRARRSAGTLPPRRQVDVGRAFAGPRRAL